MTDNEKLLLIGISIAFPLLASLAKQSRKKKVPSSGTLTQVEKRVLSYSEYVEEASNKTDIPKSLIYAVIEQESGGQANIMGAAREYGLMQVMCSTAREMGFTGLCDELYGPETNIFYGCKYLLWQYDRYDDIYKAISAYNAGHYTEKNRSYVESVKALWQKYATIVRQFGALKCDSASLSSTEERVAGKAYGYPAGFEDIGKISYDELPDDMKRVAQYWQAIIVESQSKGVDPCLVAGLIHKESQGQTDQEYHGAYGLMQLKESTAREFGLRGSVKNLYIPSENIRIGTTYVKYLYRRYRGDPNKIISAYQAGHVTSKNKRYVEDVITLRNIYCSQSSSQTRT